MPEIAEAHIMADQMSLLIGHKIISIDIQSNSPDKFRNLPNTKGRKVIKVFAIGKHPIIQLENGFIYSSLSMTGKWLLPCDHLIKHFDYVKLRIGYGNISGRIHRIKGYIYFLDSRTWGSVKYLADKEYHELIIKLGPDPLNGELTWDYWYSIITKKSIGRRQVCKFLNDQGLVSGLGNYLRSGILYDAKINPFKPISELNMEEIGKLYNSLIKIVNEAYSYGGLSMGDNVTNYISPTGVMGTCPMTVYDKPICPNGHKVEKYKANSSSQTIHYCPVEQAL